MLKGTAQILPLPRDAPGWAARRGVMAGSARFPWAYKNSQTSNIKAVDMSLYADFKEKSTKNSYLILLYSKDWLKHHGKSEKLSVLSLPEKWLKFSIIWESPTKALYGVRARSKDILTRKPMGIAGMFPGNQNFEGFYTWLLNGFGIFCFFTGMAKITTPISTNQMAGFLKWGI